MRKDSIFSHIILKTSEIRKIRTMKKGSMWLLLCRYSTPRLRRKIHFEYNEIRIRQQFN